MRDFFPFIEHLNDFIDSYGGSFVPTEYESPDGYPLGKKVHYVRTKSIKLSTKEREYLDSILFEWNGKTRKISYPTFEKYYNLIKEYYDKYGDCNISQKYRNEAGDYVGRIVAYVRKMKHTLNNQQIQRLNEIHFIWNIRNNWVSFEEFCRLHIEYERKHKSCWIPARYKTPDGVKLGEIARNFRDGKRKINDEQKKFLKLIGFVWDPNAYRKEKKLKNIKR